MTYVPEFANGLHISQIIQGMDYELGSKPLGIKYWDAKARGEYPQVKRSPNSIWKIIEDALASNP